MDYEKGFVTGLWTYYRFWGMIKKMKTTVCILLSGMALMGCKKPYLPPPSSTSASYLVVEGVVNPGSDSTNITLSHTIRISDTTKLNPVTGAIVSVKSDQNISFPLTEAANGHYVSAGLNLDNSHKYQLSIKTSDGKQYLSDIVPVTITPSIDSIGYNIIASAADTGLQLYVNTHDVNSNSRYYRWDYDETWSFHSKFSSLYISNGVKIVLRQPNQLRTFCYASDVSSNIVLGSSAKLQQNVLYQAPITFIKSTSEKIESEYSILLRQYALTPDAYNFWTSLRKNTEELGSIFDALPSQLPGNIHCVTNPAEPVIGYMSVSTVQSKRIFIYNSKLPNWAPLYPYDCQIYPTGSQGPGFLIPQPNNFVPMSLDGSLYTFSVCADCTVRGTQVTPPFFK